ncbi:MAG TPA: hypothetical protein VIK07_01030 [Bacteroidales bacterium]
MKTFRLIGSLLIIVSPPFEGGVAAAEIVKVLQRLVAAGVVDFNISHNTTSAQVYLFLRDELKVSGLFLLKMILFLVDIKKGINQPPRPGNEIVINERITLPGHPSFKRRGNFLPVS